MVAVFRYAVKAIESESLIIGVFSFHKTLAVFEAPLCSLYYRLT
jgi:hypothetical protein